MDRAFHDVPRELVAQDAGIMEKGLRPLEGVQVGPAHADAADT
jgi:hypothetical protein